MFKIALCDDEIQQLNVMEKIIEKRLAQANIEFVLEKYRSGECLLEAKTEFDVAFLDIEMTGITGIEVAKTLLQNNPEMNIVFVSSHEELVFEAIRVQPVRFVRKRFLAEELAEAIDFALEIHRKREGVIRFVSGKSEFKLKAGDIICVETSGHYLEITAKSGKYRVRGKVMDYLVEFKMQDFLQIQKGIVVNMQKIDSIKRDRVYLKDGQCFNIGRTCKDSVKKDFLKFMRKGM